MTDQYQELRQHQGKSRHETAENLSKNAGFGAIDDMQTAQRMHDEPVTKVRSESILDKFGHKSGINVLPHQRESTDQTITLISAIASGDTIASAQLFGDALLSRVSDLIDSRRQEVAQSMFNEARHSSSYQFTHTPGDEESEKKLDDLKASVKGTNKRVVLQGRLGKNNPNAHKYSKDAPWSKYQDGVQTNADVTSKAGAHSHQRIRKADAATHDVYLYDKSTSKH